VDDAVATGGRPPIGQHPSSNGTESEIVTKKIVLWVVGIAAVVALFSYLSLTGTPYECRVTINFAGATITRTGAGHEKSEAIRAAVESACAELNLGMAEKIRCEKSQPLDLQCKEPSSGY
jgi:hypothetical protein